MTRQALGRGLASLLPLAAGKNPADPDAPQLTIPIDKIKPNRLQPRKHFDPEKLSALASSIKEHGLTQPLIVSKDSASDMYELIAGERRWRASALAGLKEVEVVVRRPDSDKKRLILALIENLQREDLNPIEEALSYIKLMQDFGISQTDMSPVIGKSKSAISNTLRLLNLPEEMQKALQFEKITEGHARALLAILDPLERNKAFEKIVSNHLSVREAEELARQKSRKTNLKNRKFSREKSPDIKLLETDLQRILGTKIEIKVGDKNCLGTITIHFYSLNDFDRLVQKIKKY